MMGPLRVLFVCSGNGPHGISPFIRLQGESLRNAGVEVEFFPIEGKGLRGYVGCLPRLRWAMKTGRFDLVHAHFVFSGLAVLFAKPRGLPLVQSFMGDDLNGTWDGHGREKLPSRVIRRLSGFLAPRVQGIVLKSEPMRGRLRPEDRPRARVIPNGVDLGRFRPLDKEACRQELGLPCEARIILFLGDPHNEGKSFWLLRRASEILDSLGETHFLVTPYPVAHGVVPVHLNAADVLVLCSDWEGSPNVVKEAMACNTPIVATDVGDVRGVIAGTSRCRLVGRSPESLAEGLREALSGEGRSDGRARVGHLSLQAIAARLLEFYREVLNNRAP
jgi:glycosyltransferase involved in cell wall biosynthesis